MQFEWSNRKAPPQEIVSPFLVLIESGSWRKTKRRKISMPEWRGNVKVVISMRVEEGDGSCQQTCLKFGYYNCIT